MRHKSNAQSLVEMAMVLPFLLFICFAIIDMGWYIYGYATIYNAARRGAEKASQLPPWPSKLVINSPDDACLGPVYLAVQENAQMFPNLSSFMTVNYVDPSTGADIANTSAAANQARQLGGAIQVNINQYQIPPLTPLLTLGRTFGFGGISSNGSAVMLVSTSSRRSIESLGFSPQTPQGCSQ